MSDGKFRIDSNCQATRKLLASHVNDNVYKNIENFSMLLFDQGLKHHKEEFTAKEKDIIVDKLVSENSLKEQNETLTKSLDRILITHRNTKLLLFLMSGPFFVIALCCKWLLKLAIVYTFYKKASKKGASTP